MSKASKKPTVKAKPIRMFAVDPTNPYAVLLKDKAKLREWPLPHPDWNSRCNADLGAALAIVEEAIAALDKFLDKHPTLPAGMLREGWEDYRDQITTLHNFLNTQFHVVTGPRVGTVAEKRRALRDVRLQHWVSPGV